eukprot:4344964-Amphidinium_carterae.1
MFTASLHRTRSYMIWSTFQEYFAFQAGHVLHAALSVGVWQARAAHLAKYTPAATRPASPRRESDGN